MEHPQRENWLFGAGHAAQQPAQVFMVQGVDDRGLVSFADAVGVVLLMKFSVTIGERHVGPGSAVTGARHRPPANCLATCTPGKQEKRYIPKLSFHCRKLSSRLPLSWRPVRSSGSPRFSVASISAQDGACQK